MTQSHETKPGVTRFFFDTEFLDVSHPGVANVHLLSIGIVAESGETYYAVNMNAPWSLASNWVLMNVIPHLGSQWDATPIGQIRKEVDAFIRDTCAGTLPEFWGYYADYDWTLFCSIFGGMLSLPQGWPKLCLDLKQEANRLGLPSGVLPQPEKEHHALSDAEALRKGYLLLQDDLRRARVGQEGMLLLARAFLQLQDENGRLRRAAARTPVAES